MTAALALSASLLWGTADFLGGTVTRRLPAWIVIAVSQFVAFLLLVPVAVVTGGLNAPLGYLPWAIAAGAVGLVALAAFYSALATGTMGVVAPITATSVVVPVLVGGLQGDSPTGAQAAGIATAAVGVVLASGPGRAAERAGSEIRALGLAVLAAGGFGAVTVCLAFGARSSVTMTLLTMRVETLLVLGGVALFAGHRGWSGPARVAREDLPALAVIGAADMGANATYAVASTRGDLSLVAVLASLYPAVTVLLARQVHRERLRPVQAAGVVVALVGVSLIAAGGGTA